MSIEHFKVSVGISDNGEVVLLIDGRGRQMPWQKADEIARALTVKARKCEEIAKANRIIADNALLQRAGFPLGLSDHPKIKDETIKMALWDRFLRRALPWRDKRVVRGMGDIRTRGVVGAPVISKSKGRVQTTLMGQPTKRNMPPGVGNGIDS